MKRTLLLLITLCVLLPQTLQAKGDIKFFAKAVLEEKGKVFVDFPAMVSVYVYSDHPFGEVKIDDKPIKMNGCEVRRIPIGNRLRQGIAKVDGKPYYTVLAAQYMVTAQTPGRATFPQLDVNAVLLEEEQPEEPEDDSFFNFFDSFFRQPSYKKIKKAVRNDLLKMEVLKAPKKSAEQLKSEGKVII